MRLNAVMVTMYMILGFGFCVSCCFASAWGYLHQDEPGSVYVDAF